MTDGLLESFGDPDRSRGAAAFSRTAHALPVVASGIYGWWVAEDVVGQRIGPSWLSLTMAAAGVVVLLVALTHHDTARLCLRCMQDTARTCLHEVVDALWAIAEKRIAAAPDRAKCETTARKATTALDLYRGGLTQALYGRDYDVPGDDVLLQAAVAQIAEAQQLPDLRARLGQLVQTEEAAIDLIAFATGPHPGADTELLRSFEAAVERFHLESGLPAGIADEPTDDPKDEQ